MNTFLGAFPDVDMPFRGLPPFGKEIGGGHIFLCEQGGSVAMLPPLESATAEAYVRTALDLLENTESSSVPLSFAIFLPYECFRDLTAQPRVSDLRLLDPRLGDLKNKFIIHAEPLTEGQHVFFSEDHAKISDTGSIFLLLQNREGQKCFPLSERGISNIIRSLSLNFSNSRDMSAASLAPTTFVNSNDNPVGNNQYIPRDPNLFSSSYNPEPSRSRHGRVFQLEENGEDETGQDDDVMRRMYANFNKSMFQNNSLDVDIENLALMGIGGGVRDEIRGHGRSG